MKKTSKDQVQRFDPVSWSDDRIGWQWDMYAIKECEDGDYVLYEDYQKLKKELDAMKNNKES